MSVPQLSQFLQKKILDNIINRKIRTEVLDKKPTVLQLSPEILFINTPNLNQEQSLELYHIMVKLFKKITRKYTTRRVLKDGPMYIDNGTSFSIIGANYATIQKKLATVSKNSNVVDFMGRAPGGKTAFDVGHVGGFGLEEKNTPLSYKLSHAIGKIDEIQSTLKIDLTSTSTEIKRLLKEIDEAHAVFRVESEKSLTSVGKLVGRFKFIFTIPQYWKINQKDIGSLEKAIFNEASNIIKERISEYKSSKSYLELIDEATDAAFLGKKVKPYKSKAKVSKKVKGKGKTKLVSPHFKVRNQKGQFTSLIAIQSLLNLRLHNQVKQNMGKGSATELLNYRTGRFAESVQITAMQQREDKIVAFYTYMRNPYDIFLPGRRLHKPRRDPRKIINRAIRQLSLQLVSSKFKVYPKLGRGG